MDISALISKAIEIRNDAYCPYSGYGVGAALLTSSGKIFAGCNVENASYSMTMCAERSAVFSAVSAGERDFSAIAIVGGLGENLDYCPPCGACRQVLSEFCDAKEFKIILARTAEDYRAYTLEELLPLGFKLKVEE